MTNGIQQEVIEWAAKDLGWEIYVYKSDQPSQCWTRPEDDLAAEYNATSWNLKPAGAWDVLTKFGLELIHFDEDEHGIEHACWAVEMDAPMLEMAPNPSDPEPLRAVELALVALYNREVGDA